MKHHSQVPMLPAAVRAAVRNQSGQVLLHYPRDLPVWALPGGKIEEGEQIEQAAIRGSDVHVVMAV